MQKVTTFLWFNTNAEEAMNFYVSVFNGAPGKREESKVVSIARFPDKVEDEHMKGLEGKVAQGCFMLDGQTLNAFDGGPQFKFNEAISLCVDCQSQEEVDYYWDKLSAVSEAEACGWLKDKYGLSWQIVPKQLGELMSDPNSESSARVLAAMMQMKKLDIQQLQTAADR